MERRSEVVWVGLAIVLIMAAGIGSSYFMGANNAVEQALEADAERLVEKELHITPGLLKTEFEAIFECTQKGFEEDFHCVEQQKK